jgi:hypothetical protein
LLGAIFAPWRPWAGRVPRRNCEGPWFAIFLLHWLLFRLMFFSGYVKLASGDATWKDGTALAVHYESQPLPTWIGWWAHQLPEKVQIGSCVIMFLIELALPFVMFFGRRGRAVACAGFCGLMVAIMTTGNYTFFNWLTIFLALTLLDDACWPVAVRQWVGASDAKPQPVRWPARSFALIAGAPLFVLSLIGCTLAIEPHSVGGRSAVPPWARTFYAAAAPFRSVNNYGLFRVMTTERNEIVIEVSADGNQWHEVEFRWKPGDLARAPAFVAPHQPRLDWQMWFAAFHPGFVPQRDMNHPQMNWFGHFLGALLAGKQPVWELIGDTPIPPDDVNFIRCQFYRYTFTGRKQRRETGQWWTREFRGPYSDTFSRR